MPKPHSYTLYNVAVVKAGLLAGKPMADIARSLGMTTQNAGYLARTYAPEEYARWRSLDLAAA